MSKIKVFLGGYVNYTNAQNLNCSAIAENLDKDKFEAYALRAHFGDNKILNYKTFLCFYPIRISYHFGFLWGLINADVLYLPKHVDTPIWVLKLSKILKKPMFTTIEGNVTDLSYSHNLIGIFKSVKRMQNHFSYFNVIFGITQQLIDNAKKVIKMRNIPLFLGVRLNHYSSSNIVSLRSIIFVGGLTKNKCVYEFIELAKFFPMLDFKVVGEGPEHDSLLRSSTENVFFLGRLNHDKVIEMFLKSDLMFLPSKSEGFPKVILEAASTGTPSIVYNNYCASDWLTNNSDAFIVDEFHEVKSVITRILDNPKILEVSSAHALKLASRFNWKNIIKDWENVIVDLHNEK